MQNQFDSTWTRVISRAIRRTSLVEYGPELVSGLSAVLGPARHRPGQHSAHKSVHSFIKLGPLWLNYYEKGHAGGREWYEYNGYKSFDWEEMRRRA